MDNKKKIIISTVVGVIVIVLLLSLVFLFNRNGKNKTNNSNIDLYNQQEYKSATLPTISGSSNKLVDEFGKTQNTSQSIKEDKTWDNLKFYNFSIYSLNPGTSTMKFEIYNSTSSNIQADNYQLQLLDDDSKIVSIIDFETFQIPSLGKRTVQVSITGDITNVKDIKVDDINYTMKFQGVK